MTPAEAESVTSCADDQAVQPWRAEPYRLWSLLDMMRFLASEFCQHVGIFPQVWPRLNSGVTPDDESVKACFASVNYLIDECQRLRLPVSLRLCRAIQERIESGQLNTLQELGRMVTELYSRVIDELSGPHFMMLELDEAEMYETPLRDWGAQVKAFPSTQDDITEAMKCQALNRSTACVFHLMRTLEVPLKVLSAELNIVKHSPTWEGYLSLMADKIAAKFPDKSGAHQAKRSYFTALEGHLRAIKTAWRNPTMHDIAKVYTPEMANELTVLVRGFMREAAKELKEVP